MTSANSAVILSALLVSVASVSCAGATSPKSSDKSEQSAETPAKPAAEAQAPQDKVKVVEGKAPEADDRFELVIDTPEATAGAESKVTVRVVPKKPWHMNLEYPTKLELEPAEGVTLAKAKLKKGDATQLDEHGCQYDVAFTAAEPGESMLTGEFKFAVCEDEGCFPVTRDLAIKVAVK